MAAKKSTKKKTIRKSKKTQSLFVFPDTLLLKLDTTTQNKLKKVLKDGGTIEIKLEEMAMTQIPDIGTASVDPLIDVRLAIKRPKQKKKK